MAITDNAFTADEMKAALTANPQLSDVLVGIYPDVPTFKDKIDPIVIAPITLKHAQTIEKDVKELTGIDKLNPDEKYFDYMKRAFTETKKAHTKLEAELTELKSKGDPSSQEKARIGQLEKAIKDKNDEILTIKQAGQKELSETKATYEIKNVLAVLRASYKPGIPQLAIDSVEEKVTNALKNSIQIKDGKTVVVDTEGDVVLDKSNFQPVTVESKARELLGDVIDPGRQQQGAGGGPKSIAPGAQGNGQQQQGGQQQAGPDPADNYRGIPPGVTTKVQLSEHLTALGITVDNPKFDEILLRDGKGLRLK